MLSSIEDKVARYVADCGLLSATDRVLVGLSGGADSVCLMLMLQRLGYECAAVHCNFHLRGAESVRDEEFVRQLCERLGVRLHLADFDTEGFAHRRRLSVELAARTLRYDHFQQLMQSEGYTKLAVGHHMDDNAETFLLRAVRKTGVSGLCGIRPLSVNSQGTTVVRPLLCLRREQVEVYLRERGESWVTDSTNLEDEAARNRVRHMVIPALQTVSRQAVGNICSTMENLREVLKVYEAEMQRCIGLCVRREGDTVCIDRRRLQTCVSPLSVLHEVLWPLGFNETQIRNLLTAKGYRPNRPKDSARPMRLRGGRGTAAVEISWEEIRVTLAG